MSLLIKFFKKHILFLCLTLGMSTVLAAPIKVAVEYGASSTPSLEGATKVVNQLNDDTFYDFDAIAVTGTQIDTQTELDAFDVIVIGNGGNNQDDFPVFGAALRTWVENGGSVLGTGWLIFAAGSAETDIDAIIPVNVVGSYRYGYNTTQVITNDTHPVTQGLSDFSVPGCCIEYPSTPQVDSWGTVLGTVSGGNASIVVGEIGSGCSVYLGPAYTGSNNYTSSLQTGAGDQLLEQAVSWLSSCSVVLDADNDSVLDASDNCPAVANADQADNDESEGLDGGDACDADDDNDLVLDDDDNCPNTLGGNADQTDTDGNGTGDICDDDIDGDNVDNYLDNCPYEPNEYQDNNDNDLFGDACDPDDDNDGVADAFPDNCQYDANPDQSDVPDADGIGNVCDADDDNDGALDVADNCPLTHNPGQVDYDADLVGDACDPDDDNDGVLDGQDICERTPLGEIVDPTNGCTIVQLCPCEGPRGTTTSWRNHGKFQSCTAKTSGSFVDMGLITDAEKDVIVSDAAHSSCGDKRR